MCKLIKRNPRRHDGQLQVLAVFHSHRCENLKSLFLDLSPSPCIHFSPIRSVLYALPISFSLAQITWMVFCEENECQYLC
jgi:hypothetical protein